MKTPAVIASIGMAFVAGVLLERYALSERTGRLQDPEQFGATGPRSILAPLQSSDEFASDASKSEADPEDQRSDRSKKVEAHSLRALLALSDERAMEQALHPHSPSKLVQLLGELEASGNQDARSRRLKRLIYRQWAHMEPQQALKRALQEDDTQVKRDVIHTAFSRLTEEGRTKEALGAFASLQTHRQRQEAVYAMADRVPFEEMGTLASFLAENAPNINSENLYRRWGEMDPTSPLLQAMAVTAGPEAVRAAARGWAHADPSFALEMARAMDSVHPQMGALRGVLESLADWEPAQASQWIDELPPGHERRELVRDIANRWSQEDLDAALAWTETLDERSQREAMQSIAHQWARKDPQAAADFALSLPPSEQRREALREVGHIWARGNAEQAAEWAATLGPEATSAFHGVLETVAEQNPQMAADMVAQWGESVSPNAYREFTSEVAGHWSSKDPLAAAAWAQTLPTEGEVQRQAIEHVADHWVGQDAMAASEWIGTLPEGELRDVAAGRLVDHVAPNDPDSAFRWALSVSNAEHQIDMLHHVFEQWQEIDLQAAQNALQNAPITAEQRQDLGEIFQSEPPN